MREDASVGVPGYFCRRLGHEFQGARPDFNGVLVQQTHLSGRVAQTFVYETEIFERQRVLAARPLAPTLAATTTTDTSPTARFCRSPNCS